MRQRHLRGQSVSVSGQRREMVFIIIKHIRCQVNASFHFCFLGSSSGLMYSMTQGPSPWNWTMVSPSTQT